MRVTFKLYAMLGKYLPPESKKNEARVELEEGATVNDLLRQYSVPEDMCHLVLVNGTFVPPDDRNTKKLEDGDALAVWPPVAGG